MFLIIFLLDFDQPSWPRISPNVRNKNAVAKRTLIDKFCVSEAMVHFTFLLLLAAAAVFFTFLNKVQWDRVFSNCVSNRKVFLLVLKNDLGNA